MTRLFVQGHCPMGCGQTLFYDDGGRIACALPDCPRPDAVHELLADSETEHLVRVRDDSFSVQHPLRERLDHELLDCCALHEWLRGLGGPPSKPGLYRAVPHQPDGYSESRRSGAGGWDLERLPDPEGT